MYIRCGEMAAGANPAGGGVALESAGEEATEKEVPAPHCGVIPISLHACGLVPERAPHAQPFTEPMFRLRRGCVAGAVRAHEGGSAAPRRKAGSQAEAHWPHKRLWRELEKELAMGKSRRSELIRLLDFAVVTLGTARALLRRSGGDLKDREEGRREIPIPPKAGLPGRPDGEREEESRSEGPLPESIITQMSIQELRAGQFLTNDMVEITGGMGKDDVRELTINGGPPIKLDRREFIVLLILHRRTLSQPSEPGKEGQRGYVAPEDIVDEVERMKEEEWARELKDFWNLPGKEDVRRCIYNLRRKIRAAKGNENLVESAPQRGRGYRLSTPSRNVVVSCESGRIKDAGGGFAFPVL